MITANDNESSDRFPRGDAVGFRALLLDRQRHYAEQTDANIILELTSEVRHSHISLALSLIFWLAAVTSCIWGFYTAQSIGLRIFSSMATIWTGLWTAYLAKSLLKPRLGEISVFSALLGFVGMLLTASTQLGFPLQTAGGIAFFSGAALVVSYLTFSRIGLMTSIAASLCWAALQLDGYILPSSVLIALPCLILGQLYLSVKLKSRTGIFAAMFVTYVWLYGFAWAQYLNETLSPLYIVAGMFMIGGMHYHAAKAAMNEGWDSTPIHLLLGWCVSILGLIGVQHYSLYPMQPLWSEAASTAPVQKIIWALLMLTALGVIGLSGLVRRRHGKMTLASSVFLVGLFSLLPLSIWFETDVSRIITAQTGLPPHPATGMFLGGIILAIALNLVLSNLKRGKRIFAAVGLGVAILQGDLSLRGAFLDNSAYLLIMIAGFALAIGAIAIVSKSNFDPYTPQRPLRKSQEA